MDVFQGKSIVLKTVAYEDIEKIRIWRNSKEISQHFIFREHITKQAQIKWFNKVSSSKNDFYFSVFLKNELIGLTEIKNINWSTKTGEGGIFIIPAYQNSFNSFETSLLGFDFSFGKLKLKKNLAKVLKKNTRALKYNKLFGYKEYRNYEQKIGDKIEKIVLMELAESDYRKSRGYIAELIGLV